MMNKENENQLLVVDDLAFSFHTYAGEVQAVRGVSFTLKRGKTLGIVGESGCGKSVTAKSIVRLNPDKPSGEIKRGKILFDGEDIASLSEKEMEKVRAKKNQDDFSRSNDKPESHNACGKADYGRYFEKRSNLKRGSKEDCHRNIGYGRNSKPGRSF